MPYNCWNCWATLEVDDHMKAFQDKFNGKGVCFEAITKVMGILIIMVTAFFII